jgi:hypothetical protein
MDNIKITLLGTYCNEWPLCKISINREVLYNGQVENTQTFEFTPNLQYRNQLQITHYGKWLGPGRYDTERAEPDGPITADRALRLEGLNFNDVELVQYAAQIPFVTTRGEQWHTHHFGHNGTWELEFYTPIYDWIIERFVRRQNLPTGDLMLETSHQDLWDYKNDKFELDEIERLLECHAYLFDKSS